AGASSIEFGMRAANEASNAGWKRFVEGDTSLTVTYQSNPNVPSSPSFSSPSVACGTATSPADLAGDEPIVMQADITDPDGVNVGSTFSVINGTTSAVLDTYSNTTLQAEGDETATIPTGTLSTGLYAWNATATDGTYSSTGASANCYFEVINQKPALPGASKTSSGTPTVGQPMTMAFTSAPADGVALFAYWWVLNNATSASEPSVLSSITPGSTLPACGSTSSGVYFVCPDSGSTNVAGLTLAPIDDVGTLWVASYNAAGQVSVDSSGHFAADGVLVDANDDTTNVSNTNGHIWDSETIDTSATAIPDLNTTTGSSGTTTRQPLEEPLDLDNGNFEGIPTTTLDYTTGSNASMSDRAAVDTLNSFTVSAWLYAAPTWSASVAHVATSEIGSDGPAFTLGTAVGGGISFCRTSQVNDAQACAVGTVLQTGTWTLVTGIWDSANQQLRVLKNDTIAANASVRQPVVASDTSAEGWLCVGGGCSMLEGGVVTANPWDGQLFRPAVFPGVIASDQLENLYQVLSPNDDPPADTSIGAVVNYGCDDIITLQNMYDFNSNYGESGFAGGSPDAGTDAAQALAWNGVACRWIDDSSNVPLDFSVASILDRGTMLDLQNSAAANGTAVTGLGDSAYYETLPDGDGELQVFDGSYWITFRSPWFWSAGDAGELPGDAIANLANLEG
ncbi:MAG TPA: LamG-like jellyroll fold domain-containing protein, partial [Galbitalea sp.]|nr:LamG-like jellyroll fold domain-containing protein [Galbitalea sp.]